MTTKQLGPSPTTSFETIRKIDLDVAIDSALAFAFFAGV